MRSRRPVDYDAGDVRSRAGNSEGSVKIRLDSGRGVCFDLRDQPHLDHGYAVTSHSGQGATAHRVLVHVDTETEHSALLNSRLAYVSISRARFDAQIWTNDARTLGRSLSHEISKQSARLVDERAGTPSGIYVASTPERDDSPGFER